jgi:hypothetical protein
LGGEVAIGWLEGDEQARRDFSPRSRKIAIRVNTTPVPTPTIGDNEIAALFAAKIQNL